MPKLNRHRDIAVGGTAHCSCCSVNGSMFNILGVSHSSAAESNCIQAVQADCCGTDCRASCPKLYVQSELSVAAAPVTHTGTAANSKQHHLSDDAITTTRIHAAGLCCPVESRLINSILGNIPGVQSVNVTIVTKAVEVQHAAAAISPAALVAALNAAGLQARLNSRGTQAINTCPAGEAAGKAADASHTTATASSNSRRFLDSFLQLHQQHLALLPPLTVLAAGCLLLLNLLLLIPAVPAPPVLKQGLLALVAAVVGVPPVMQKAWAGLRNFNLDMNSLVVVALFGAVGLGEWYEAGALIFLFTLAEWLEDRCISTAAGALEDILRLQPEWALVVVEHAATDTHAAEQQQQQQDKQQDTGAASSTGSSSGRDVVAEVMATTCCSNTDCCKPHHHHQQQQQQQQHIPELVSLPATQLEVGTLVLVRPGDKVPVDGVIEQGSSVVDESMITGEAKPITRSIGDAALAGTVNTGSASLRIRATAAAADSTVARLAALMEAAAASKSKHESAVEKFARYYTPLIVVVALLVVVTGAAVQPQQWQQWAYLSLVVLVTGCPCALVISTPVANVAGLTCAARKGVLIKGGRYLELLSNLSAASFDKSGTLTEGHFQVSHIHTVNTSYKEQQALQLAAALEQHSNHPIAHAIVGAAAAAAAGRGCSLAAVDVIEVAGKGVSGIVDGQKVTVGSWEFVKEQRVEPNLYVEAAAAAAKKGDDAKVATEGPKSQGDVTSDNVNDMLLLSNQSCDGAGYVKRSAKSAQQQQQQQQRQQQRQEQDANVEQLLASAAAQGATAVCVSVDHQLIAVLLLSDTIRPDALQALQQLHALNVRCVMLTGDSAGAAATVAKQLGMGPQDVHAQLLPQDKLEVLRSLRQQMIADSDTGLQKQLLKSSCLGNSGILVWLGALFRGWGVWTPSGACSSSKGGTSRVLKSGDHHPVDDNHDHDDHDEDLHQGLRCTGAKGTVFCSSSSSSRNGDATSAAQPTEGSPYGRLKSATCIAHIGDGVNDAPALAAADVGIAMGVAGAALAVEAADVALFSNHLTSLPFAIRLGRRAACIVRVNVMFACTVKVAVLVCAAAGAASLWLSLLADVGSSLLVTIHALTLLWFEADQADAAADADNANASLSSSNGSSSGSGSLWQKLLHICSSSMPYQRLTAASDSAAASAAASRRDSFTYSRSTKADALPDHHHHAFCDHHDHHDGCCMALQPSDAARASADLEQQCCQAAAASLKSSQH